ncbi:MAG: FeoA family protein [Eubacteriales bacterium]|nr:FeoA family protein [Eubacteriales bacterium]
MPLTLLKDGEESVIVRITGEPEVRRRLMDMGFIEGSRLRVLSCVCGNLIVEAKNIRIALDKKLAKNIKVA